MNESCCGLVGTMKAGGIFEVGDVMPGNMSPQYWRLLMSLQ